MTATKIPNPLLPAPVEQQHQPPQVRVVTVFSAKGGAGSTMVATNMAVALQLGGARVCLLDLSLAFGDVAVSLQLAPQRTIMDALEIGVSPTAIAELVTAHPSGLECVLSPVDPTGLEKVPADVVRALIGALRARYDVVVIDTASELSEHVLEAFDAADRVIVVTAPEIPAIKNTRIGLDMMDLIGYPRERRRIVLNQADPSLGLTTADVEGALQCEVSAELPSDRAVPLSVNNGVPLVAAKPAHPLSRALREFAVREVFGANPLAPAAAGRARWRRRSA